MKKILGSKKLKEASPVSKKKELTASESRKRYEEERVQLKEVAARSTAFSESIATSVAAAKRFSGSLLEWGTTTDSTLATTLALVASFQTALGDVQVSLCDVVEEKLNGPLRDMLLMERELLNASKKEDAYRSEEMKVETFRMSLVERFCEYLDSYAEIFKKGSHLLSTYVDEAAKTRTASRKQVEEILNFTLEVDAEVAAEVAAQVPPAPPPPIFGSPLDDTIRRDGTPIPRIVLHLVAYLEQNALSQMGIFRISGHTGSVQALKEAVDSGHEVDLSLLNNSHVAATLFKLYLRTLPDTLTIGERFDNWIEPIRGVDLLSSSAPTPRKKHTKQPSSSYSPSDDSELGTPETALDSPSAMLSSTHTVFPPEIISALASLVNLLPANNARTLDYLIGFCTKVVAHAEENMMGAKNLASLIAPNILNRPMSTDISASQQTMLEDVSMANKVVECMILHYDEVFADVRFALKDDPLQFPWVGDLELLASEFPLCADRSVKHGDSLIVDLPPDEVGTESNGEGGHGRSEKARERGLKKKTVSSLSLIKDRKIKKKEKTMIQDGSNPAIQTATNTSIPSGQSSGNLKLHVGENDFKVPQTNTSSLRPLSPRSLREASQASGQTQHTRTASELPPPSRQDPSRSVDAQLQFGPSGSLPSSMMDDDARASALKSLITKSSPASSEPSASSPLDSSSPLSSSTTTPITSVTGPKKTRKSSKATRKSISVFAETSSVSSTSSPSLTSSTGATIQEKPSKRKNSAAAQNPKTVPTVPEDEVHYVSPPKKRVSVIIPEIQLPPAIVTTRNRRHSITTASEEGYDPTKENFGSIGPAAAIALQSSSSSNLSVDALVDDQSGSMRLRPNSRRASVFAYPFSPTSRAASPNGRSGSFSSASRPPSTGFLTPTKAAAVSPPPAIAEAVPVIPVSVSPPPSTIAVTVPLSTTQTNGKSELRKSASYPKPSTSPTLGSNPTPTSAPKEIEKKKSNIGKDRTAALISVKFENPEEFNKVMDERFGKGPVTSYVVIGYSSPGCIKMQAGGEGGVTELVNELRDDQIQYCLIRISYLEDGNSLIRDVFVQWNGPKVSVIQKGIKKAHCGEVKNVLCPTAIELLASSKTNFTLETLLERSAPTASRIID